MGEGLQGGSMGGSIGSMSMLALFFSFLVFFIFILLPIKIQKDPSPQKGNETGAPVNTGLKWKFLLGIFLSILGVLGVLLILPYVSFPYHQPL